MESARFNNNASSISLVTTALEESEERINTFMEEVKTYKTFKIATFISNYWFPVLVPIGVVGNILSFIVMVKPNNRKMSTCIYMAAISINDNIMMYVCFEVCLVVIFKTHQWHPVECKIMAFCALFGLQNCTFQILAMTIDKYIAIKWPHRAATYSTPRRARMIAMSLYVCVFIYNVPHFFFSSIIGNQCLSYGISSVISRIYSWFSFVLNAIIPFTLLIHMNYIIVKTVRNSRKSFRDNNGITGMEKRQTTMKTAENQLTIMLLLVTTLFLILLCPTYFRFIYLVFAKRDTPRDYAKSMIIYEITSKLYLSNSGINFFLYCLSGKKFRNDLKEILCCFGFSRPSVTERKDGLRSHEISTVCTKTSDSLTSYLPQH